MNYGVGNLFSIKCSLDFVCEKAIVTDNIDIIRRSDKIILPGVGAFESAAKKISDKKLDKVIKEEILNGKPLLGICLGMQLLFDISYEFGLYKGLGLIRGCVVPIKNLAGELKIPHMGWNNLIFPKGKEKCPIFKYISEGDSVYFVHSYHGVNCEDFVSAQVEYGTLITASVWHENIYGVQFHPEKSGSTGLKILKAFCEI